MASEILAVPERHLKDTIKVIRSGLEKEKYNIHLVCRRELENWCDGQQKYIDRMEEEKEEV